MDKVYGQAFQAKVEQEAQKHQQNLDIIKKYVTKDPLVIRDNLNNQVAEKHMRLEEVKKLDQVFGYVAKTKDQEAIEQRALDFQKKQEQMNQWKE